MKGFYLRHIGRRRNAAAIGPINLTDNPARYEQIVRLQLLPLRAVPTGLTGVLLILWLTDTTLNVMSLMGVVMMVGIVVSNSILLVEFTHRLREDGKPLRAAVALACRVRLRPILMTSLATLFGLLPMALKLGTGAESYAPLARAIIGGLGVSVVLTMFIVPAAYLLVHRRQLDPAAPIKEAA
jgi:multidrug efflux pump subunit AcrB